MKVCILSNDDPAAFQSSIEALWSEIKEKAKPDFHKIIEP